MISVLIEDKQDMEGKNAPVGLPKHIPTLTLLNGPYKSVEVLDAVLERGHLIALSGLRPFDLKDDEGCPKVPTIDDAQALKRSTYIPFFQKSFKNLLILSGAGSSLDVGGPLMSHLWTKVEQEFRIEGIEGLKVVANHINFSEERKDLEALLSQIDGHCKFAKEQSVKIGEQTLTLSEIKTKIFKIIVDNTTLPKPVGSYPHKLFLEKMLQRKQTNPRVKVFTLNYDLMFEYAATDVNAIVIDGFSFTYPRTFSGRLFDYDIVQREGSKLQEEDNFIQRVFHLHKLHGSLNWERHSDGRVIVSNTPSAPLMVYPREAKYEDSYEQPYFEMMARFQRSLRINNDTLLICVGYSFNDKHINAAIEEALNQNPGFRLAVIDPYFDSEYASESLKQVKQAARDSDRIILISETFDDFAKYFPEMKTYESENQVQIILKNDNTKN